MIIEIVGLQHVNYTRQDQKKVEGYQVYGIVLDDDYITPDLDGNTVFDGYFSCGTLSIVPQLGSSYRVLKQRSRGSEGQEYDRYIDLKPVN